MNQIRRLAATLAPMSRDLRVPHISCRENHGVLAKLVVYLPNGACAFRRGGSFAFSG